MDAIDVILSRRTTPPAKMRDVGPDDGQLVQMLEAAAAAPDHGRLRPFRFVLVRGARRGDLGAVFARALKARNPDVLDVDLLKQKSAPLRAPLIVVVIARIDPDHPKIPAIEQHAAASAAAQNLLLAAHALGFAGKWATGENAYDPIVRAAFGLGAADAIVGFLNIGGAPEQPLEAAPRPALEELVRDWRGVGGGA